jgi:formylglycine-generating enzyme required for sulfatase activity/serine/threonine protein kinase
VYLDSLREIGRYRVEGELGRGGAGRVYKAVSPRGEIVAIKVITIAQSLPRELERAERESDMQRELAGLAGFVDWIESGELRDLTPYLVMKYLPGGTLRDRLSRGPLSIGESLDLIRTLAAAMGRAHARGVVHRDLKPENVLFDEEQRPVISDMGLAKHFRIDTPSEISKVESLTKTGELRGTAAYMAPEQVDDPRAVGPAADVYSLGVILYECLTGTTPYTGVTALELFARLYKGERAPVRKLRPDAPRWLAAIVERCLSVEPRTRFADANKLLEALESHSSGTAALPLGTTAPPEPRRGRAVAVGASVLALGLAVAAGLYLLQSNHAATDPGAPESPLAITIDEPSEGATFFQGEPFRLKGRVSSREPCELSVNGARATSKDGLFQVALKARASAAVLVVSGECRGRPLRPAQRHLVVRTLFVPEWFWSLPAAERPPLPLPSGLQFATEEGLYRNEKDGSLLIYIAPGVFLMGSDEGPENERPVHEVELSGYFIGQCEITNEQFKAFADGMHYTTTAEEEKSRSSDFDIPDFDRKKLEWIGAPRGGTWRDPHHLGKVAPANDPVVTVSWKDAQEYLRWAGLVLPTEAQWERACAWDPKTKKARRYSWGDYVPGKDSPRVANVADRAFLTAPDFANARETSRVYFSDYDDGFDFLAPVGSFPAGASPCGALDMIGNAGEWCRDGWDGDPLNPPHYPNTRVKDPCSGTADAALRASRGGSFLDGPDTSRAQFRWGFPPTLFVYQMGFRAVLEVQPH